ncbi:GNAT family N-acetyltransferase [Ectopseudomonas composti]|jgi:ribosomal protein S18 acetylase RimI-like enzyme|uniref:GCN5 family acetyltransferase n=1 Tax=Ectopseudomonas composti TaxID=658457 RepID=A0A1I5PWJ4_9GAMM|nr:GNAT family N-acetyltransferase [Pseudomonas composti]EZH80845.1 GCN5 family acetyltransferase [Pseudomonas composti]MDN5516667.1 GNAT family N-acetyltransferase [Pseudomonas sp.]SFP38021.1 L-amino acid N-acyltransferase YncA [Pseudomonas composti]
MSQLVIRQARDEDIEALCALILEHGPNPWNHLPEAEVREHLNGIAAGTTLAVVAEENGTQQGFVSYRLTKHFAAHQPVARARHQHGYICEAVVHRDCAGRGLGARLLDEAVQDFWRLGVYDIYIDRHEENAASAGMMRKAGFAELLTYADPARRPNGSGRSTLCCLRARQ